MGYIDKKGMTAKDILSNRKNIDLVTIDKKETIEKAGMMASGKNPATGLVEIIELPNHPFFIGVQYHPELKSTVENPQPVFVHFIKAAREFADGKNEVKNPLLQSEMI